MSQRQKHKESSATGQEEERRSTLEPANAINRPGEYYRRRYSEEDLLRKSPVDIPAEVDVIEGQTKATEQQPKKK